MGNVVPFRTADGAEMEQMLVRARERLDSGKLQGLILVSVADEDTYTWVSGGMQLSDFAYAIACLQAELNDLISKVHGQNQEGS